MCIKNINYKLEKLQYFLDITDIYVSRFNNNLYYLIEQNTSGKNLCRETEYLLRDEFPFRCSISSIFNPDLLIEKLLHVYRENITI